jgi:hypothetical protein
VSAGTWTARLRIDRAAWQRFGAAAEAAGTDRSEVLRQLIDEWMARNSELAADDSRAAVIAAEADARTYGGALG